MALAKLFRTTVFKVSLAYLVISAVGAGLVLSSVGWNMDHLIREQIAQTIDTDLRGLTELYRQSNLRRLVFTIQKRIRRPGAGLYLVTFPTGDPIAGNIASLPPDILNTSGLIETEYQPAGDLRGKHRALARVLVLDGGFHLLVGHDLEEGERLRQILGRTLFTSVLWLAVFGTLGGLWISRRVLMRVDAISANARAIVAGDLSGRLRLSGTGDEFDRLVLNFNAMLERISKLMAGLKEVTGNIAHDLKTPLTRLRAGMEQALRTAKSPDEYRVTLEKALDESDRLIQIFDALLSIARAEAGAGREGMSDFDAGSIARDVGELYEPVAEERGVLLSVSAEPGLYLHGSRELAGQAVANLVDNALKYGSPEISGRGPGETPAAIELAARRSGGNIEFIVADRGPGIAEKDRKRVLDRFVRLENARSRPGSGLGLSLAAAVARLHNGNLRIEDNNPGLRAVISLPGAPVRHEPRMPLTLPRPDRAA
ncbi:MAG: ATP-binding protein [Beijerinckiaceae bacterium]|nr:ATP-binding protein [Beijerinckiaceae bacterium]MCI0736894.1 ATP-binding protein [Beijerinckiaceae bacterium]